MRRGLGHSHTEHPFPIHSFFLTIAILQFFPKFATISPGLVILPLIVVIGITAIKDGYEDAKRHQSDHRVNYAETLTLVGGGFQNHNVMGPKERTFTPGIPKALRRKSRRSRELQEQENKKAGKEEHHTDLVSEKPRPRRTGSASAYPPDANAPHWETTIWEDVKVGDFVMLHSDDQVPADIVICATSESDQVAFVETKNLDGETNLKSRHAVPELSHLTSSRNIVSSISTNPFRVEAEAPDINMYKLNASVSWNDGQRCPIDLKTVLLRGTVLRNTEWIVGIVLYSGTDTKIVLNSSGTPSKRSRVERQTNPMV